MCSGHRQGLRSNRCNEIEAAFLCRISNPRFGSAMRFLLGMLYASMRKSKIDIPKKYWLENAAFSLTALLPCVCFQLLNFFKQLSDAGILFRNKGILLRDERILFHILVCR